MRNIERIAIEGNAEIVISKISPDILFFVSLSVGKHTEHQ